MSSMSIRRMADIILDTIDPYKTGESKYTPQFAMQEILVARNHFARLQANKSMDQNKEIESIWFTEREATIVWDPDRERYEAPVTNGVLDLENDRGIRILPYAGNYNPFRRCPQNFVSLRPDLAFAEGNILWTYLPTKVVFPFMAIVPGSGKIIVSTIDNGMPEDLNAPMPMPSGYEAMVMDMALNNMLKIRGEDRKTDTKPGDSE